MEVCVNGVWGTICDYKNEWTLNDTMNNTVVVCNQLNLTTHSKMIATQLNNC